MRRILYAKRLESGDYANSIYTPCMRRILTVHAICVLIFSSLIQCMLIVMPHTENLNDKMKLICYILICRNFIETW